MSGYFKTHRHCEQSEAIFMLSFEHKEIASSLRSFMPYGYRNDVVCRGSFVATLLAMTSFAGIS